MICYWFLTDVHYHVVRISTYLTESVVKMLSWHPEYVVQKIVLHRAKLALPA